LAKAHPFPERLILDDAAEPDLNGDSSDEEWLMHDRWFANSCEHAGYLISERLGNISMVAHIRELARHLQRSPGSKFPVLLERVIYSGSHTGDWLPNSQAAPLLEEVKIVLHSADVLSDTEREFFEALRRLCEASIATGNPIMF
jgi:hypothetical protein